MYNSNDQLVHEEGHSMIFKRWFDMSKPFYEQKYEKTYGSLEACEEASWQIRNNVIGDLQNDLRGLNDMENPHDDFFERSWERVRDWFISIAGKR